jgi:hypothetical protein
MSAATLAIEVVKAYAQRYENNSLATFSTKFTKHKQSRKQTFHSFPETSLPPVGMRSQHYFLLEVRCARTRAMAS